MSETMTVTKESSSNHSVAAEVKPDKMQKMAMTALVVGHHLFCLAWAVKAFSFEWTWFSLIAGTFCGTIFCDMLSTLTHFALDNYGTETTPIVGLPIHYFREHHHHPLRMMRRDHIENVWTECLYADVIMCVAAVAGAASSSFFCMWFAWAGFWGGQMTAIHKASHTGRPALFYRVLQNTGLIISRDYHAKHHKHFNSHHSLLNGLVDRTFAKLQILPMIESVIYFFTGHIAIHSTIGLAEPARESFSERGQHLKWLIWYRLFDWITAKQALELRFMNWGYHNGAIDAAQPPYKLMDNADKVLPAEPNLRAIDITSLQLYLHLLNGPNVQVEGKDVVEVSSGKGGGLSCLAASGVPKSCTGIDLCEGNIDYCRKSYAHIDNLAFQHGDAMGDLGVAADYIINVEASHCYPSRAIFFKSVYNALRPGGRLLFVDFMHVKDVVDCRAFLADANLKVEKDENVTPNVLKAMERTDEPKRALIAKHSPAWMAPLVHRFAATKNSTMYRDLSGDEWVYHLFQAVKQ